MVQLNFAQNFSPAFVADQISYSNGTMSFIPFKIDGSISFNIINLLVSANAAFTHTISFGLYSLTGGTLSLANSGSGTVGFTAGALARYASLTDTSAAQNITPGNWWFGLLITTANNSDGRFFGDADINPGNAFPGGFYVGRMSESTNALPSSYATSDLDITGSDAVNIPLILLTA